jgi:hypothetical protein
MVQILRFKNRFDIDAKLKKYRDILAVQSEEEDGVVYCISDGKFAILCWDGAVFCPMEEVAELQAKMRPEIQQEIKEILEIWR